MPVGPAAPTACSVSAAGAAPHRIRWQRSRRPSSRLEPSDTGVHTGLQCRESGVLAPRAGRAGWMRCRLQGMLQRAAPATCTSALGTSRLLSSLRTAARSGLPCATFVAMPASGLGVCRDARCCQALPAMQPPPPRCCSQTHHWPGASHLSYAPQGTQHAAMHACMHGCVTCQAGGPGQHCERGSRVGQPTHLVAELVLGALRAARLPAHVLQVPAHRSRLLPAGQPQCSHGACVAPKLVPSLAATHTTLCCCTGLPLARQVVCRCWQEAPDGLLPSPVMTGQLSAADQLISRASRASRDALPEP